MYPKNHKRLHHKLDSASSARRRDSIPFNSRSSSRTLCLLLLALLVYLSGRILGLQAIHVRIPAFPHWPSPAVPITNDENPNRTPRDNTPPHLLPTAPRISLVDLHTDSGKLRPTLNTARLNGAGCSAPRRALVGVVSAGGAFVETARRHYLHQLYARMNSALPLEERVEFRFVVSEEEGVEEAAVRAQVALEREILGQDLVWMTGEEVRDGMGAVVHSWFRHARDELFSPHPTIPDHWCQNYLFVGKTDDHVVIHVARLSEWLDQLPQEQCYAGLPTETQDPEQEDKKQEGMDPMLLLLTADLTEWLHHSPLRRKTIPQSLLLHSWLNDFNTHYTTHPVPASHLHALDDTHTRVSSDTLALRGCMETPALFRCLASVLEPRRRSAGAAWPLREWGDVEALARRKLEVRISPDQARAVLRWLPEDMALSEMEEEVFRGLVHVYAARVGVEIGAEGQEALKEQVAGNGAAKELSKLVMEHIVRNRTEELGIQFTDSEISLRSQELKIMSEEKEQLTQSDVDCILMCHKIASRLRQYNITASELENNAFSSTLVQSATRFANESDLDAALWRALIAAVREKHRIPTALVDDSDTLIRNVVDLARTAEAPLSLEVAEQEVVRAVFRRRAVALGVQEFEGDMEERVWGEFESFDSNEVVLFWRVVDDRIQKAAQLVSSSANEKEWETQDGHKLGGGEETQNEAPSIQNS
ncbi:hypothetical protein BC830DRAFT_1077469 [Chytriomyces sp. MP71]|nr:hypothetical protein BC830DRAFT_1077469 [Chytriomyces sp. MP71]